MPSTTLRILRESLNIARYAATPIIVEDRPQVDPAWLNGLRARLIGLLARVDAEIAGDPHAASPCDSWSDDERRLSGLWLHRTHPDLPSDAVIELGDAWKDGLRNGLALTKAQRHATGISERVRSPLTVKGGLLRRNPGRDEA